MGKFDIDKYKDMEQIVSQLYEWAKNGNDNIAIEDIGLPESELYSHILYAVGQYRACFASLQYKDELVCPYCGCDMYVVGKGELDGTPFYEVDHDYYDYYVNDEKPPECPFDSECFYSGHLDYCCTPEEAINVFKKLIKTKN